MRCGQSHDPPLRVSGLRVVQVVATTTGGTGAHVQSLTRLLVEAGADVTVCAPPEVIELFELDGRGAHVQPLPIGSRPQARDARTLARLRRTVAAADVVHAHSLRAGAFTTLVVPRSVALVTTLHNAILETGARRRVLEGLQRLTVRRSDVVLCVSSDMVEAVEAAGAEEVRRTFISAPRRSASRSREQAREELGAGERLVVLAISRLHPQKDLSTLVRAAALLRDVDPLPLVAIAGGGPGEQQTQTLIDELDAPVELLGERADVPDLLVAADVSTLSSRWEGCPLSVQESLRAGVPFVGTRVGGVPDLVSDAGLLVPADDAVALSIQLRRVLTEPALLADLRDRALRRSRTLPSEVDVAATAVEAYEAARASSSRTPA